MSDNKHQTLWDQEHHHQATFTTMHTMKPAIPLPSFADFLKSVGYVPTERHIFDAGCGKGRNSMYLASLGYHVTASDFSEKAIEDARARSKEYGELIQYEVVDLSKEWPYATAYFDALIDCNTTIYMPADQREYAVKEAFRVLKPGAFYLFYGIAFEPQEGDTGQKKPSTTEKGYVEKHYTEAELIAAYSAFGKISVQSVTNSDKIEGKDVNHLMWVGVFQKPVS